MSAMAEGLRADRKQGGQGEKLPRAHKRCVNTDCREVLSLATQYCKKCNAVQFERRASQKQDKQGSRKRKASEEDGSSLGSEEGEEEENEEENAEEEEEEEDLETPGDEDTAPSPLYTSIPQVTNYSIRQMNEACDQEPFDCRVGPEKPMVELIAGMGIYFQATIIRETQTEIRVIFPETKRMEERIEWVDKRSSRIWRGRMESRYWRYIKGSDGGWEPKPVGESNAAASSRRRGSGKSRGSVGVTRSRGTKHSTEDGTESAEHRRAEAAALDTAASPKPRNLKRKQQQEQRGGCKQPRDGAASSASSDGEHGNGEERGEQHAASEGRGGSEAEHGHEHEQQGSGAVGSTERGHPRAGGGSSAAVAGDPLEAWFKQHYALLKSSGLLGAGFVPASAETGRPWANGAAHRRRGPQQQRRGSQQQRNAAAVQRSRDQRRHERQAAAAQSSEGESSEDERLAAAAEVGGGAQGRQGRGGAKGGRELKRLQMWAWERRGRSSSDEGDEDEEGSDDSKDSGDEGSAQEEPQGAKHQGDEKPGAAGAAAAGAGAAAKRAPEGGQQPAAPAAQQQQARPQQQAQQHATAAGAEPNGPSPASASKPPDVRSTPGSNDVKQPRGKAGGPSGRSEQQHQQAGAAAPPPPAQLQQQAQPKPRPPPKPLARLEECDVFGRVDTIRRQQSGLPLPPTSPRAAASSGFAKLVATAAAGAAPSPTLHKAPSDVSARPGVAGGAAAPFVAVPSAAAAAQEQQGQAGDSGNAQRAAPVPAAAAAGSEPAGATAKPAPPLSPLKRKMLERSGAAGGGGNGPAVEGGAVGGAAAGEQPPAKRQHMDAGRGGAAAVHEQEPHSSRKRLVQTVVRAPQQ